MAGDQVAARISILDLNNILVEQQTAERALFLDDYTLRVEVKKERNKKPKHFLVFFALEKVA